MNGVFIHLDNEIAARINVEKKTNIVAFSFGYHADMFMTIKQAKELFQKLDEALHEPTMTNQYMKDELSEKEDRIFSLQDDLDTSNSLIEQLEDNLRDAI